VPVPESELPLVPVLLLLVPLLPVPVVPVPLLPMPLVPVPLLPIPLVPVPLVPVPLLLFIRCRERVSVWVPDELESLPDAPRRPWLDPEVLELAVPPPAVLSVVEAPMVPLSEGEDPLPLPALPAPKPPVVEPGLLDPEPVVALLPLPVPLLDEPEVP